MDQDDILASYGGLPPSAFTLSNSLLNEDVSINIDGYEDVDFPGLWQLQPGMTEPSFNLTDSFEDSMPPFSLNSDELGPIIPNEISLATALLPDQDDLTLSAVEEALISQRGNPPATLSLDRPVEIGHPAQNEPKGPVKMGHQQEDHGQNPQTRFVIPDKARELLQNSLELRPYPSKQEQEELAHETSLTFSQVKTWFNNNRSRLSKKHRTEEKQQHRRDLQKGSESGLTSTNLESFLHDASPEPIAMERFLDNPLEEYPVSWYLIAKAAEETTEIHSSVERQSRSSSRHSGSNSSGSVASFSSRGSRRGRRALTRPSKPVKNNHQKSNKTGTYFCTFCPKSFNGRHEWNRHEESIHIPHKIWVCKVEQTVCDLDVANALCPLCGSRSPTEMHMAQHKYDACSQRPHTDRIFYRYDHLKQHLRQFHGVTNMPSGTVHWTEPAQILESNHLALRCGFCGFRATSWKQRCDHLSKHFSKGINISEWWLQRRDNLSNFTSADINLKPDWSPWSWTCPVCEGGFNSTRVPTSHFCVVWSCSFLKSPMSAIDYSPQLSICRYCSKIWTWDGDRTSESIEEEVRHLTEDHKYRSCEQKMVGTEQAFKQHLVDAHLFKTNYTSGWLTYEMFYECSKVLGSRKVLFVGSSTVSSIDNWLCY